MSIRRSKRRYIHSNRVLRDIDWVMNGFWSLQVLIMELFVSGDGASRRSRCVDLVGILTWGIFVEDFVSFLGLARLRLFRLTFLIVSSSSWWWFTNEKLVWEAINTHYASPNPRGDLSSKGQRYRGHKLLPFLAIARHGRLSLNRKMSNFRAVYMYLDAF